MLLLACPPGRTASYAAALLFGSVLSAEVDFTAFLVRRYLGKVVFGIFSVGVVVGPMLLSLSFDRQHSFQSGLSFEFTNGHRIGPDVALPPSIGSIEAGPVR